MDKSEVRTFTDEQLVSLATSNNEFAVEELFNRYKYIASSVARSYFLSGGDTEDLLQEGLFALFKAINTFNGRASFKTYVYTCVKNRIFTIVKSSKTNKNLPLDNYLSLSGGIDDDVDKTTKIIDNEFGPEEVCINTESENELKEIISENLSKFEYRILFYYLKGYSYSEISAIVNKKEKSIDNAIQRIRKKLLVAIKTKKTD